MRVGNAPSCASFVHVGPTHAASARPRPRFPVCAGGPPVGPSSASDASNPPNPAVDRLLVAVDTEVRNRYSNIAGVVETFAQYASRELRTGVAPRLTYPDRRRTATILASTLDHVYPTLDAQERAHFLQKNLIPFLTYSLRDAQPQPRSSTKNAASFKDRGQSPRRPRERAVTSTAGRSRTFSAPTQRPTVPGVWPPSAPNTLPDTSWKAISRAELRAHPLFSALPPTSSLPPVTSLDHLARVRQDSQLWQAARTSVQVSASNLFAVLGFAEDHAGRHFGIRRNTETSSTLRNHKYATEAWKRASDPQLYKDASDLTDADRVRMDWGTNHEANALVTFMDAHTPEHHQSQPDKLLRVSEVGMFVLTRERFDALGSLVTGDIGFDDLPVMASSPDASVIRRDRQGRWAGPELLEVKSRCPFIPIKRKGSQNPNSGWLLRQIGPHVQVQHNHFAQIQLQLACAGLQAGHLVSHAASGATTVFEVPRDDEWLKSAFYYVARFNGDFVAGGLEPHENFFLDDPHYEAFLHRTKTLCASAKPWLEIPPGPSARGFVKTAPDQPFVPSYRFTDSTLPSVSSGP